MQQTDTPGLDHMVVGAVTDDGLSEWVEAWTGAAPFLSKAIEYSPAFAAMDVAQRFMSPYQTGVFFQNPLSRIVREFRYDAVCSKTGPDLHVCATNVRTGKIRVFEGADITPDAILASACLPTLFQAVEIDGEAYWDGGYTGNPALYPLFDPQLPDDIVIVNINPLVRHEVPRDPQSIQNRINEISFNSSLLRELRAIDFVKRLLADGSLERGAMKDVNVHMIADDDLMNSLSVATKLVPTPIVLARLKSAGETAAKAFLAAHRDDIGTCGTVDLAAMFG